MKNTLRALLLTAILSTPALAADTTSKHHTASESSDNFNTTTSPQWGVDAGIGTLDSKFAFGVGLRAEWPNDIDGFNIRWGGQTGFYIGPSSPSSWAFPILVTATHDFGPKDAFIPYVGIGVGLDISHTNNDNGTGSNTGADFAFLFKPGVKWSGGKYYFEVPLGTVASAFYLLPSIGVHF